MKKILYSIFALALALPAVVSAATFSFTPVSGVFTPGKTFTTTVSVNPKAGEKITTAKMDLSFPSSLVEVVSFKQASGWVPLAVPGYDLIDNTKGELIKSGGFPAKVTALKEFGTITFKIKAPGAVTVETTKDSVLLDSNNVNKYSAGSYFKFTAVKPEVVKPVVVKKVVKPVVVKKEVAKVTTQEEVVATTTEVATTTLATDGLTANVAESASATTSTTSAVNTSSTGLFTTKTVATLVVIILLLIGAFFLLRKKD